MEDYIKCELIGGGSLRHLNTFSNLYIVAVHCTHQSMLCIVVVLTVPMYTMLSTSKYQNIPYFAAIVGCTQIIGYLQFPSRIGNIVQENTTADILIEDQPQPPLDMVTVDQELYKPNR